jgi:hypothetical protein
LKTMQMILKWTTQLTHNFPFIYLKPASLAGFFMLCPIRYLKNLLFVN